MKKVPAHAYLSVPALVFVVALTASWIGLDFGDHWDETNMFTSRVYKSVLAKHLLPGTYAYGSLGYDIAVASLLPDTVGYFFSDVSRPKNNTPLRQHLARIIVTKSYLLRLRAIYAFLSFFAIFWIYFTVRKWRGAPLEAGLAAAIYGLSWELSYHSRWVAIDPLLTQFGALTMMLVVIYLKSDKPLRWLYFAAISAGFACGTKIPGGLFLLPVILAALFKDKGVRPDLRFMLKLIGIFTATYIFTTPGLVLDTQKYFSTLGWVINQYQRTAIHPVWPHTVAPGPEHLTLVSVYLALVAFSPYHAIAAVFFGLSVIGLIATVWEDKKTALIYLSFPVIYLGVVAVQKVMLVRNLLMLFPFLAVFAARGTFVIAGLCGRHWQKAVIGAVVAGMLFVNGFSIVTAGISVKNRLSTDHIAQLAEYIDDRPEMRFILSTRVWDGLSAHDRKVRANITRDPREAVQAAVFYSLEPHEGMRMNANRVFYTMAVFGPRDVNFNYYPMWLNDRIIVMPVAAAKVLGGL